MPDRLEKLDNALVPERVYLLVKLEMMFADQAIDERQTRHHNGLPGLGVAILLVRENQFVNSAAAGLLSFRKTVLDAAGRELFPCLFSSFIKSSYVPFSN